MIQDKDILPVGRTQKPHGIRGEVVLFFDKPSYADVDADFYFLEMDGIPVPFFVEELVGMTDVSSRVKFLDTDDEKSAARLVNKKVLLPRELVSSAGNSQGDDWNFFTGYTVIDQHQTHLGTIQSVDDSTLNVLFIVVKEEKERLIPATEDFITGINEDKKIIRMHLPEGLLES